MTQMPPNNAATRAAVECSLADLSLRTDAWVHGLHMDAEHEDQDLLLRLVEIGFLLSLIHISEPTRPY